MTHPRPTCCRGIPPRLLCLNRPRARGDGRKTHNGVRADHVVLRVVAARRPPRGASFHGHRAGDAGSFLVAGRGGFGPVHGDRRRPRRACGGSESRCPRPAPGDGRTASRAGRTADGCRAATRSGFRRAKRRPAGGAASGPRAPARNGAADRRIHARRAAAARDAARRPATGSSDGASGSESAACATPGASPSRRTPGTSEEPGEAGRGVAQDPVAAGWRVASSH